MLEKKETKGYYFFGNRGLKGLVFMNGKKKEPVSMKQGKQRALFLRVTERPKSFNFSEQRNNELY